MKLKNIFSVFKKTPIIASIGVAFIFMALVLLTTYLLYVKSKDSLIQEIKIGLASSVSAAASLIDGDVHSTFTKQTNRKDSLYLSEISPLEKIRKNSKDIRYIYTNIIQDGKVYFMYNPSPQDDNDNDGSPDIAPALMDVYNDPAPELLEVLEKQVTKVTDIYIDQWGTFISAYTPFYNSKGEFVGSLGMDQELSNYYKRLEPIEVAFEKTVNVVLFIGLVIGLLIWYLRKQTVILEERNEVSKFKEQEMVAQLNTSYKLNSNILTSIKNSIDLTGSKNNLLLGKSITAISQYQNSISDNVNNEFNNFNLKLLFKSIKQKFEKENIVINYNYNTIVDKNVYGLSSELYELLMSNLILFLTSGSGQNNIKVNVNLLDEGINDYKFETQFVIANYPTMEEDLHQLLNPELSKLDLLEYDFKKLEILTTLNKLKENHVKLDSNKEGSESRISMKFNLKKETDSLL